jgi:membrane-associated phospholipid phosphatase
MIVGYLAYLIALLPFRPVPRWNRARLVLFSAALVPILVSAAWWPESLAFRTLRAWMPLPFILLCYWLSGLYFVDPQPAFEARFVAFDRRVRAWLGADQFARRAPRLLLEFLELAYFGCYVVLPAGMGVLVLSGRGDLSDRFWSTVVLAEVACYGVLPWIRTRPWWVLCPAGDLSRRRVAFRRLNVWLVRHASTTANTFPSGHAAGAVATALAVLPVAPMAGVVLFAIAVSIMAGAMFGEYHYAGDVISGTAVALAAWGVVALAGV